MQAPRPSPRVAVIGSARLGQSHPAWQVAFELGERLARSGFTVVTGGYGGLMAAVSRGAREANGHVVGLPMSRWEHLTPNEWNVELVWAEDYPRRLASILESRAVIALPGGVGTLSEMAVTWSAIQTEEGMPDLILIGEEWRRLVRALSRDLVVDERDLALVHVVSSAREAVDSVLELQAASRPPSRGPHG